MRAVAHILAVTVLLDRRQKDQEMIEFCHSVMTINQRLRPGVILPRKTILSWYEAEREKIAIALANDTDDTFKTQALEKIRDPELRRSVLASIFAICICDYEFQDEEAAFIKIALNIWKSGMPSLDEMTLIAG
ncbi:hypothetical protein [Litorimonas cladophorae]|nr:hypothetical protein [Litorimonas cladophorae]